MMKKKQHNQNRKWTYQYATHIPEAQIYMMRPNMQRHIDAIILTTVTPEFRSSIKTQEQIFFFEMKKENVKTNISEKQLSHVDKIKMAANPYLFQSRTQAMAEEHIKNSGHRNLI